MRRFIVILALCIALFGCGEETQVLNILVSPETRYVRAPEADIHLQVHSVDADLSGNWHFVMNNSRIFIKDGYRVWVWDHTGALKPEETIDDRDLFSNPFTILSNMQIGTQPRFHPSAADADFLYGTIGIPTGGVHPVSGFMKMPIDTPEDNLVLWLPGLIEGIDKVGGRSFLTDTHFYVQLVLPGVSKDIWDMSPRDTLFGYDKGTLNAHESLDILSPERTLKFNHSYRLHWQEDETDDLHASSFNIPHRDETGNETQNIHQRLAYSVFHGDIAFDGEHLWTCYYSVEGTQLYSWTLDGEWTGNTTVVQTSGEHGTVHGDMPRFANGKMYFSGNFPAGDFRLHCYKVAKSQP